MNPDDFLDALKQPPRPEFARALREQLRDQAETEALRRERLRPWAGLALAAAALVLVFTIPAVRASATAFLDLFRVHDFAAVSVDPARLEQLDKAGDGKAFGVFDDARVLREPGPPARFATYDAAAGAAGMPLLQPQALDAGFTLDSLMVTAPGEMELTMHRDRIAALLEALQVRDVEIPEGLDGRAVHVSLPRVATAEYRAGRRRLTFVQAASPEVGLPAGVDPIALGELGLRVLGLDADEAHRLASQIDWRSTLVVPVPVNAASFRAVTVQGGRGLLISAKPRPSGATKTMSGNMLLWSKADRVFALGGPVEGTELLRTAESVR